MVSKVLFHSLLSVRMRSALVAFLATVRMILCHVVMLTSRYIRAGPDKKDGIPYMCFEQAVSPDLMQSASAVEIFGLNEETLLRHRLPNCVMLRDS